MSRLRVRTRLGAAIALAALGVASCDTQPDTGSDPPPEVAEPETPGAPEEDARAAPEEGDEPGAGDPPAPVEDGDAASVGAYGVSAGHPAAVGVGIEVLEDGGNAVEAAVATAYAVSVAEPFGSGIGGGGAAVVLEPGGDPVAWDYRVVADESGEVPATETGIPGFVAGMEALHDEHGSGDPAELIEPAIALAEDGTEATSTLADQLQISADRLPVGDLPHLFPGGAALEPGAPLVQDELADTLRAIADGGAEAFYRGDLAEQLAGSVDGIDTGSLDVYEVTRPDPATGEFAGYEVVSAAPSLTGPKLVQTLQLVEALGIDDFEPGSPDFVHALAMAGRIADRFRLQEMGDPAFVDNPIHELTDPDRNALLAEQVRMDAVLDIDDDEPYGGLETDIDTTHLTVVDADGTMVSMTNTLSNLWGSGQHELGFFLNDQLRNFDDREGSPNRPEPGKRTVAHSTPTIIADDDSRPVLGLGSPGGPRIPHVLAQVIARWAAHDEDLAAAVLAPRFHLDGDVLRMEEDPSAEVTEDLLGRGYADVSGPAFPYYFGSVQALEVDHEAGRVLGAADPRRDADWQAGAP